MYPPDKSRGINLDFMIISKRNEVDKAKIKKQVEKILDNPDIGKPMRYGRKGTREVYVARLAYSYNPKENKVIFLDIYHKDGQ